MERAKIIQNIVSLILFKLVVGIYIATQWYDI
jgi:hypothetical protein